MEEAPEIFLHVCVRYMHGNSMIHMYHHLISYGMESSDEKLNCNICMHLLNTGPTKYTHGLDALCLVDAIVHCKLGWIIYPFLLDAVKSYHFRITSHNVDKPKRRQPKCRQTETSTNVLVCRRFGLSTFWTSTFRFVDVLTSYPFPQCQWRTYDGYR